MAYVNVAEWKTDQVCEWLKGLDNAVLPYVHSFMNHGVNGQQLLSLRPEDLEYLGVLKLGHQEIILEAVEYLRNFHYELDRENLQLLALRLSCQAHSLHNELLRQTNSKLLMTQTLSDVATIIMAVKPLVRWLDRPPFSGQLEYNDKKTELMRLSLEMATCAQRDRFAEKPIEEIRMTCSQLAKLADYIIQDIADPMILQPASLDLATLKKRPGDDLGFYILPSFHGVHQIAEIKFGSAAHQCGKMEEGDEIVQVNYQTVVGWEQRNVLKLFRENPGEMLLTLKRRPRHTKVYGQIYIKPYRLPSNKKTSYTSRWQHNLPSPRPELLTIPDFTMPLPRHTLKTPNPEPARIIDSVNMLDPMTTDSSDSDSEVEPPSSIRLYSSKPRNLVHRRATITGASPITKHGIDIEQFWKELKHERNITCQLRDKAASCAHGLDSMPSTLRPQTCLGIEPSKRKKKNENQIDDRKVQFQEKSDELGTGTDKAKRMSSEGTNMTKNSQEDVTSSNKNDHTFNSTLPLDECNNFIRDRPYINQYTVGKESTIHTTKERGKLDKSHSTPAYDLTDTNDSEVRTVGPLENLFADIDMPTNSNKINSNVSKATVDNVNTDALNNEPAVQYDIKEQSVVFESSKLIDLYVNSNKVGDKGSRFSIEEDQNINENITLNNNTSAKDHMGNDLHSVFNQCEILDNSDASNESSEEKSESTNSCVEGTCSNSSEGDGTLKKYEKISQNTEYTAMQQTELRSKSTCDTSTKENNELAVHTLPQHSKRNDLMLSSNITENASIKTANFDRDSAAQICRYTELPKVECIKKLNNKKQLVPPEPPPRKHLSKVFDSAFESSSVQERAEAKKDLKRTDTSFESSSCSNDCSFTEKSSHISQLCTSINLEKQVATSDALMHKECNENRLRDETGFSKHESLLDKFPNNSQHSETKCEYFRNGDHTDGSTCSRQSPEHKLKISERERNLEKSVVNKAMMVARSIGLHGNLGKSSGSSPRSGRKRNTLLAKKRNVSVKDIGTGDLEGWLTYRSRGAGGAWAKAWFILKCSSLYRFKSQDSTKADCLIALTGFTVAQAAEVKSRKYAFKVYHTGTVFYFAADTEDCLILWLDAINKATFGTDAHNRTSGLFSETDESDSEHKSKEKNTQTLENKSNNKSFDSLRKNTRKDSSFKEHDIGGASLDRKYLKFLGAKNQNLPVPTAQFRSYRRVLPSSASNRKQVSASNSPDLQITVAGSTFYGLSASQSATDMTNTGQDLNDYRRPIDSRSLKNRGTDDLQGFITLEEFMLSQQDEEGRRVGTSRSVSPRVTPLTTDHVLVHHKNFIDKTTTSDEMSVSPITTSTPHLVRNEKDGHSSYKQNKEFRSNRLDAEFKNEKYCFKCKNSSFKKSSNGDCTHTKVAKNFSCSFLRDNNRNDTFAKQNTANEQKRSFLDHKSEIIQNEFKGLCTSSTNISKSRVANKSHDQSLLKNVGNAIEDIQTTPIRLIRNDGYSNSSSDLTCHTTSETFQRAKKTASVSRKGSFNLTNRCRDYVASDKHWLDSLKRTDKKTPTNDKFRLKNVAQYQPPPIPSSPFEQEGMRAAFEMHLDKNEQVQKANRLKSLFGSKSPKPSTLDISRDTQKTLLGSPRLHRALFRDKGSNQQLQQRLFLRSGSQSPGDSGISQSISSLSGHSQSQTFSQSFSSTSSASDWSPDTPTSNTSIVLKSNTRHSSHQKGFPSTCKNFAATPISTFIPAPTSPPPDYPGLEYPPVFEPGTYSLLDASLLRSRNRSNQNGAQ